MSGVAQVALCGAPGHRWSPGAPRHFAWQAWHLVKSTFVSCGRCVIWRHLPAFGVAGAAQVALGGALGRRWSPGAPRHFAWQAWHLVTSTFVSYTTLSHTIFQHTIFSTQHCHTPFFAIPCFTHRFVTQHLSHTTLSHALFHTQLSHTPSFTHNFVTHTIFLCHTPSFTYHFVTHNSSHTTCFTSRSSITSFVFPSFPLPPTTFVDHYWKKLTCGVIRSFIELTWCP